jgi:hypothetical protein
LNKYALPYVEILGMGSRRSEVVQLILEWRRLNCAIELCNNRTLYYHRPTRILDGRIWWQCRGCPSIPLIEFGVGQGKRARLDKQFGIWVALDIHYINPHLVMTGAMRCRGSMTHKDGWWQWVVVILGASYFAVDVGYRDVAR